MFCACGCRFVLRVKQGVGQKKTWVDVEGGEHFEAADETLGQCLLLQVVDLQTHKRTHTLNTKSTQACQQLSWS